MNNNFCLVHSLNLTILSRLNQIKFDMGDEYKQSMTMMMGMSGVSWLSKKVMMKIIYDDHDTDHKYDGRSYMNSPTSLNSFNEDAIATTNIFIETSSQYNNDRNVIIM